MLKETKHERFRRIAGKRTNDVLDKMRLLGNCSNKNTYEYSKDEVNKIFNEIEKYLKIAKSKYLPGEKQRFQL
jgi:hypothetical protein